ncbi:MAG: hypothetical protein JSW25_08355 [Thermoplasmata archaeon]|nr:MAG: hypothetical protein JSW25_08355 [Thermoplasmata archaeon]
MRDILRRLQRGEITLEEAEAAIDDREAIPSKPAMGTTVRREAARPGQGLTIIFWSLVVLEVLFASMFLWGLIDGWDQRPLALVLAAMFLTLGVMTDVYRTGFMPDKLVVKRRKDKVVPRQD